MLSTVLLYLRMIWCRSHVTQAARCFFGTDMMDVCHDAHMANRGLLVTAWQQALVTFPTTVASFPSECKAKLLKVHLFIELIGFHLSICTFSFLFFVSESESKNFNKFDLFFSQILVVLSPFPNAIVQNAHINREIQTQSVKHRAYYEVRWA